MKKYTIKEFAEGKKAVKIENKEQWNKLNNVFPLTFEFRGSFIYGNDKQFSSSGLNNPLNWYIKNNWEVLEFSQLDFEDEFIVGSWYEFTNKGFQKGEGYVKFVEKINDVIWYNERIFTKTFTKNKDWCHEDCDLVLVEDLSEIQQYLPENHPDLIKKDTFVLPERWCRI